MKSKIFICMTFLFLVFSFCGYSQSEKELFDLQVKKLISDPRFIKIQSDAAEFTKRKLFGTAVNKIKGAIKNDFYYDFNDNANLNPKIIEKTDKLLKRLDIQLNILTEKKYFSLLDESIESFTKTVYTKQFDLTLKHFNDVKKMLIEHAKIRNEILQIKTEMQNLCNDIFNSEESDNSAALQIILIEKFISGIENVENSGIFGCFDFSWNSLIKNMNDAVFTVLQDYYNEFVGYLNNENSGEIYKCLYNVEQYALLQTNILNLYNELKQNKENIIINPIEYYYVLCETLKILCTNTVKIYELYTQLNNDFSEQKDYTAQKKIENNEFEEDSVKNLHNLLMQVTKIADSKDYYNLQNFEWFIEYKKLKKDLWNTLLYLYNSLAEKAFTQAEKMQAKLQSEILFIYKNNANLFIADANNFLSAAQRFMQGFNNKISNDDLADFHKNIEKTVDYAKSFDKSAENDYEIFYCYPDLAEKILSVAKQKAVKNKATAENYLNEIKSFFDKKNYEKNETENFLSLKSDFEELKNQNSKLEKIIQEIDKMHNLAKNKSRQSELAKNEADLRFSEAENALKNHNFDIARKKLQNSLKKYDESLSLQNDELLRIECDKKLYELGMKISKEENEVVVKDVRRLKSDAKDAYYNRRFEEAEKLLNQAKNRWAVTNEIPDEETETLSNFVNVAISMKTGRDLPPTAPQYPEMSQLLNISYKYFDEGNLKIAQNDKKGGFKDFDIALENIHKLQLVYPLNQEASILTLRIDRIKDPKKFEEEFEQKINAAKLMCENPKTRKEGYANLLDYYELEPSRKGLKDLIWKTEIEIGIRQKEPDNSETKKANQLLTEAQKIYENAGSDEKKLKQALKLVDQSLNIVMDNPDAIKLKDKITTKIGGTAIIVLSTENERLYQLAVQKLQANNVIGSNIILQKILENPANASLKKVQDLKNKIEAKS